MWPWDRSGADWLAAVSHLWCRKSLALPSPAFLEQLCPSTAEKAATSQGDRQQQLLPCCRVVTLITQLLPSGHFRVIDVLQM